MRLILRLLTLRISTKIVLPYLLLGLCLSVATTFVAVRLTAGALQERLNNRLIEAGQVTSDELVAVEAEHLEQLRAMAFTRGVAEALASGDTAQLATLLRPTWANSGIHTLVAFDTRGRAVLAWQRDPADPLGRSPQAIALPDLDSWWIVRQIVEGRSDAYGDKFSTFRERRFYTAAPVRHDGRLLGGLIVGLPNDLLLARLQERSQASVTTLYDAHGRAFATTQVVLSDGVVPSIPAEALAQLGALRGAPDAHHVQSVVPINRRDYQFAYSPLRIRRSINGSFSVALSRGFILDAWAGQGLLLVGLSLGMLCGIIAVGLALARHINRPLNDLVTTARAVTSGELHHRVTVRTRDELGVVGRSFNQMTERLLLLYTTSRGLSAQHSIADILVRLHESIQPLAPDTSVAALLATHHGWRCHLAGPAAGQLGALDQLPIADDRLALALAEQAEQPIVLPADDPRLGFLPLGRAAWQVWAAALRVKGEVIGLLLVLGQRPGALADPAVTPLATIAGMAAASFQNALLYQKVEEEGNRRRAILESIADGVIVCNADREVVLMNPAAEDLLGVYDWQQRRYDRGELPLAPLPDAPLHIDGSPTAHFAAGGRILSTSSAPIAASDPASVAEVLVLHDITQEAELDQAKTDLIALISHELRTPLTAIRGAIDMLCKGIGGELPALHMELAHTALRQTQAMSQLVEKAVLLAGIEAGTLRLQIAPLPLSTVVEAAVDRLRAAAAAAGVELRVALPADLPLALADAQTLSIALEELIENAIAYAAGAPVEVGAQAQRGGIALTVRDSGAGIPAEELPHLFHRLRRSAGSVSEARRGLGLGLVITRELVERQGGTISVESEQGVGSRFTIMLLQAEDATHPALASSGEQRPRP